MIKWVKNITIIATSSLILSGCSIFNGDEDVVKMAELTVFEATYKPVIAWSRGIGDGVDKYFSQLQPAVDTDAVYVAARDGEVKAFSLEKGEKLWSVDLSDHESNEFNRSARLSGGIGIGGNMLYIGTENAQVFALDPENGDIKWMSDVSGEVIAQPVYDSNLVVVHTSRGELTALDSNTGKQVWTMPNAQPKLSLRGSATPTISQGGVVYGRADGFVAATLLATGQPLWQIPVARPYGATELDRLADADMKPVIVNGIVYALAYNGNLVAIDLLKGEQLWSKKYSGYNDITVSGFDIFLTDYRGYVYSIDRDTGDQRWVNTELAYRNVTGVTVANNYLVVGDAEGYLHWIDRATGKFVAQQNLDSDGLYIEPIATSTHLYLQTRSGDLIAIEKPILNVE